MLGKGNNVLSHSTTTTTTHRHPHEHLLWPFHHFPIHLEQIGLLQSLEAEVVIVEITVIDDGTDMGGDI